MQVPKRRSENKPFKARDPYITQDKYNELKDNLEKMLGKRPKLAKEVARLAELGDFSENAEYQIAKGKLRGLNRRILETEDRLKHCVLIKPNPDTSQVRLGHRVTVSVNGIEKQYQILGSEETDPSAGTISQNSPIGEAILGANIGETVTAALANGKTVSYKILKIEV